MKKKTRARKAAAKIGTDLIGTMRKVKMGKSRKKRKIRRWMKKRSLLSILC